MKIAEIFESIQGEGRFTGVPSLFIRFAGCNLRCRWGDNICDTPYASYEPEMNRMTVDEVAERISESKCSHVVLTGGEPSMHYDAIIQLWKRGAFGGKLVTVETNGTLKVDWPNTFYLSISPKLKSAGNDLPLEEYATTIQYLANHNHYQLKFVIENKTSVEEALALIEKVGFKHIEDNVYLMPEGIVAEEIDSRLKFVADACIKYGFNLTDRLHLRIWGNTRGT